MANLIVDIGNTALKAAWADGITLGRTFRYQGERMTEFILSLMVKERPDVLIISSVRRLSKQNISRLEQSCETLLVVDDKVLDKYSLPSFITPDRAASIIASRFLFKSRGCTIFDFGTMLTVDFLDKEGKFTGGCISPGCMTRFKSVNRYSRNLPLVDFSDEVQELGDSLKSSIQAGVISGMLFEVEGYLSDNSENITVFTGGDANYFAKRMKNCIFAVCNLVLMGLALIAFEDDKED
mgnify:CR=1 FL=1